MALLITDDCISCGACLPECPNEAIFETRSGAEAKGYHVGDGQGVGDAIYIITHERCTECVGHFDEPQCARWTTVASRTQPTLNRKRCCLNGLNSSIRKRRFILTRSGVGSGAERPYLCGRSRTNREYLMITAQNQFLQLRSAAIILVIIFGFLMLWPGIIGLFLGVLLLLKSCCAKQGTAVLSWTEVDHLPMVFAS